MTVPRDRLDAIVKRDYGKSLKDIGIALGYSEQNIDILTVDFNDAKSVAAVKEKHSALFQRMERTSTYSNRRDYGTRSAISMFNNIIVGWVTEDLTVLMMREGGIDARLGGVDADRNLFNDNVACTPDIIISDNGVDRWVELQTEFTHVGMEDGHEYFEPRKTKLPRCHEHKAIYLYRNLYVNKYVLVDLGQETSIVHLVINKNFGNKEMRRYYLRENGKMLRSNDMLIDELKACIIDVSKLPTTPMQVYDDTGRQQFSDGAGKAVVYPPQRHEEKKATESEETKKRVQKSTAQTVQKVVKAEPISPISQEQEEEWGADFI